MSANAPQRITPPRTAQRRVGVATLAGLIATAAATGVVAGAEPASAAPNGGACAPNDHFGRLVPETPAAQFDTTALTNVGSFITETQHVENVNGLTNQTNSQDESDIDAGYTYVGQFIDHDITLDPRPADLLGDIDPWTLVNNRTPQLDLDSVYGKGPTGSPQLYEADGMTLKLGALQTGSSSDPEPHDLLRGANGQAIIGDGRNDENKIVASMHSLMTRFHNKIVKDLHAARPDLSGAQVFEEARNQVRWYYQWAILTDFLPQMSSQSAVNSVAQYDGNRWTTSLRFYDSCRGSMPTEYAVAAYRWHTMVRDDYQVNDAIKDKKIFNGSFDARANLAGGQPAPKDFGFDWDFFFSGGSKSAQKAYKFDNSLVPSLGILPSDVAGGGPVNLSNRNLLRGNQLRLPSGQDMARSLGVPVLRDDQVIVGPALGVGAKTKALTAFSGDFAGKAPLWAYLAAESVNAKYTVKDGKIVSGDSHSLRLGPTGAIIVNETLVGLMANDPSSVVNHPEFKPDYSYMSESGTFTFRDLIKVATSKSSAAADCIEKKTTPTVTGANWWYYSTLKATIQNVCYVPVTYSAGGRAPSPSAPFAMDSKEKYIVSSSDEHNGWGVAKMADDKGSSSTSSMGWSSTFSTGADHTEWIVIDRGYNRWSSILYLYPRSDGANAGYGFPVDFTIETSTDGLKWTTRVTKTNYKQPGSALQVFTYPATNARFIRIVATKLRANPNAGNQYALQLAEIGLS